MAPMNGMDGAVEYFIDDPGDTYRKSGDSTRELSPALSYTNDDEEVDEDQSTASVRMKSHPVNVRELKWSTQDGTSHARGEFSYFIDDLPVKRDISRDVDLEELVDLEYVTEGSSSHIFSAIWREEQVIVKVRHLLHEELSCNEHRNCAVLSVSVVRMTVTLMLPIVIFFSRRSSLIALLSSLYFHRSSLHSLTDVTGGQG